MVSMSVRFGTSAARGGTCPRVARSSTAAFVVVVAIAGCSLSPPALLAGAQAPDSSFGLDAGFAGADRPIADAGSTQDAVVADAGSNPDAIVVDSGPTDLGFGDATNQPDAVVIDGGTPDAGFVDSGPADSGCPPIAIPMGDPITVGRFDVSHEIDRAVLIADFDGDGADEIAVASANQDRFSVVDFDGCAMSVATMSNARIGNDGLAVVRRGNDAVIISAGGGQISRWTYSGGVIAAAGNAISFDAASWISAHPTAPYFAVTGRTNTGPGYLLVNASTGNEIETDVVDELIDRPAFFSGPNGTNDNPRFAACDDQSPQILVAGNTPFFLYDGGDTDPNTAPAVVQPGVVGDADDQVVLYGATNDTEGRFQTTRVSNLDPNDRRARGDVLPAPLASSPIIMKREASGREVVRGYFVTTDGIARGCELDVFANGPAICNFFPSPRIGTFTIGTNESSDRITPITAYVNDNDIPDVILAARNGRVHFRTANLSVQAAPVVDAPEPISATPAVAESFFARWGSQGDLLVIPHQDGSVTLVGWRRGATVGGPERLWPQFRRDAARSGSL